MMRMENPAFEISTILSSFHDINIAELIFVVTKILSCTWKLFTLILFSWQRNGRRMQEMRRKKAICWIDGSHQFKNEMPFLYPHLDLAFLGHQRRKFLRPEWNSILLLFSPILVSGYPISSVDPKVGVPSLLYILILINSAVCPLPLSDECEMICKTREYKPLIGQNTSKCLNC